MQKVEFGLGWDFLWPLAFCLKMGTKLWDPLYDMLLPMYNQSS